MDAVITWVDGDDPVHRAKRAQYSGAGDVRREDIAAPTRFRSEGEIYFCVRSILKFAPFIENIYIITDGQDPKIEHPKVKVIDHREIFHSYEQYLPTFNSLSIETAMWRIEGLNEQFVYLNDDFMLLRPVAPNDWFEGDKQIVWGHWDCLPLQRFISALKPHHFGFKDSMANAARALGGHWSYWRLAHAPYTFCRTAMERFYKQHPELFIHNIKHRFRNEVQYNVAALFDELAMRGGSGIARKVATDVIVMNPAGRGNDYIARKIAQAEQNNPLFACIESLDLATESDKVKIGEWLERIIGTNI